MLFSYAAKIINPCHYCSIPETKRHKLGISKPQNTEEAWVLVKREPEDEIKIYPEKDGWEWEIIGMMISEATQERKQAMRQYQGLMGRQIVKYLLGSSSSRDQ